MDFLNILLIGGKDVDTVAEKISGLDFEITRKFDFIDSAFNEIADNTGEFLDIDIALVMQYGFRNDIKYEEQIVSLQEVLEFSSSEAKVYFILRDKEKFDKLIENEDIIIRENVIILFLEKITPREINNIVKGNLDTEGAGINKQSHILTEEDFSNYEEENDEKETEEKFFNLKDEETEKETEEEDTGEEGTEEGTEEEVKNIEEPKEDKEERKKFRKLINKKNVQKKKKESKTGKTGIKSTLNLDERLLKGVVIVTGDRNSGVSCTTANIGKICADCGAKTLILDFDFIRRGQSLLFEEFRKQAKEKSSINLGVYGILNNFGMIEDVAVVVEDNLALVSMTRSASFYVKSFANKETSSLTHLDNLIKVIGNAKGVFDLILVDMPMEQLYNNLDFAMMADKFILCMENTILSVGNTLEINMLRISEKNSVIANYMLGKSNIVLTKFNGYSLYKGRIIDEDFLQELITYNFNRVNIAGRLNYEKEYFIQENNLACTNSDIRNEYIKIINNVF